LSSKTVFLRALLFLALSPLMLIFFGSLSKTLQPITATLLIGTATSVLTFLLTYLFIRWDGLTLHAIGAGVNARTIPKLLFGFLIGSSLVALQNLLLYASGHAHWNRSPAHSSLSFILLSLVAWFMLALREELAFRGYPLRQLENIWGLWPALLFIDILFALEHSASGWTWTRSIFGAAAGGLLFGLAALATRGLAVPLGIHAAFNFSQWFIGQKDIPGPWHLTIDAEFAHQAEVLGYSAYLAGTLLTSAGFWFWRKSHPATTAPTSSS
jgi:membrane protease YdiL (CAAX protease family)